jgi:hypothetical protein
MDKWAFMRDFIIQISGVQSQSSAKPHSVSNPAKDTKFVDQGLQLFEFVSRKLIQGQSVYFSFTIYTQQVMPSPKESGDAVIYIM